MNTVSIACNAALLSAAILAICASASASIPEGRDLERAVTSTARPFVLINSTELAKLRGEVTGPKRDAYLHPLAIGDSEYAGVGIRAIADRWVRADIRIPTHGGHAHDFFCDCGTQLTLPLDMRPRADYRCPECGKTYSGEKYDAAVRMFEHHALANAAVHLGIVYGIERDRKYSDKAAEILRKYAEVYPGPHTNNVTGGILKQSLNEAMWIIPLAQAYDLIYDSGSLTDADKRMIEDHLFKPAVEGIRNCGLGGNWGSWHLSAVGVVGFAIRDTELVDFALKAFQAQMKNDLGDDGLWPESVHCYHFFPLQAFVFLAEAASRAGIDLYNYQPKPGKGLKAMFSAPLEYMYPNFQLPAINDGWYFAWLPLNLYEAAHKTWPDPHFAWALAEGRARETAAQKDVLARSMSYLGGASLYGFLFGSAQPDALEAPVLASTNFANFGLCTLRNDTAMLTFHYGRFLGHGHPDKLSFTLYANDDLLAADYGTPGYGSRILHWYQSTASHNTVVVDGKNQARSKDNTLDVFFSGKAAQFAEATAADLYPGVIHTRKVLLLGNACFIIDDLTANADHDFDWLIHCEGEAEVSGTHTAAEIDQELYPTVDFDRVESSDNLYRVDWQTKKTDLAFGIWAGDGAVIGLGKCPAESDARHASFLMCRKHGRDACFIAALIPSKIGAKTTLTRAGGMLQASCGDETYHLSASGSAGDLSTDAELAAVRVSHGKVTGAVIVRGSWLKWFGKTLIERPSKTDCAEYAR